MFDSAVLRVAKPPSVTELEKACKDADRDIGEKFEAVLQAERAKMGEDCGGFKE